LIFKKNDFGTKVVALRVVIYLGILEISHQKKQRLREIKKNQALFVTLLKIEEKNIFFQNCVFKLLWFSFILC